MVDCPWVQHVVTHAHVHTHKSLQAVNHLVNYFALWKNDCINICYKIDGE